jgi:tetratricopeptide (TPR) repeat protein
MPMRARFLSPSTLVYLLTASFLLILIGSTSARPTAEGDAEGQSANSPAVSNSRIDPQAWFEKGQAALQAGDLDVAEAAFRKVLVADPQAGSAYANLGVIAMRRKDWERAITLLHKAERLEPKMAGIRLNIGIVEYRRGNYAAAIAPLSSVLRDQPDSQQARYLLGLCQVFTKKFAEAVTVLEPLWSEKSNDVLYLYLYDIAAVESGQKELDEKILSRMVAVGGGTPEFHLIMGKAFLNRFEVAEGKAELELAAAGSPDLPYLHLNLGITYMRLGDNERAEAEFRRDIALEPDLADNYEQLGVLYSRMQRDEDAEKSFREALKRDAKSAGSYLGLAKLYQKQNKPEPGLKMVDAALRLSPDIHGGHFLRGRILTQLGRRDEARVEFAAAQKGMQGKLDKERESQDDDRVPNPELTRQPQP